MSSDTPLHAPSPYVGGLRERKKLKTRDDLRRVAFELFSSRGYEVTTVEDIVGSIDVSKRTFFRYFDGKEDVLLSTVREMADLLQEELERRPPAEQPFAALRAAGSFAIAEVTDRLPVLNGTSLYLLVIDFIESTPALFAAHLRALLGSQEAFAAILAQREGVDPVADPRPRLLVAVYLAAVASAQQWWHENGGNSVDALIKAIDRHLDSLGDALSAHWRDGA